jgi:hypothetical protein
VTVDAVPVGFKGVLDDRQCAACARMMGVAEWTLNISHDPTKMYPELLATFYLCEFCYRRTITFLMATAEEHGPVPLRGYS